RISTQPHWMRSTPDQKSGLAYTSAPSLAEVPPQDADCIRDAADLQTSPVRRCELFLQACEIVVLVRAPIRHRDDGAAVVRESAATGVELARELGWILVVLYVYPDLFADGDVAAVGVGVQAHVPDTAAQ